MNTEEFSKLMLGSWENKRCAYESVIGERCREEAFKDRSYCQEHLKK